MGRLQIDQAKLNELLTGRTGPVYRVLEAYALKIVEEVQEHGPIGFEQGGTRDVGALRRDMRIRSESRTTSGVTITVGTDPVNNRRPYPYHYAAAVHRGRAEIDSATVMRFRGRNGVFRATFHVGPAEPLPFLWEAVERANAITTGPKFGLTKTE